MSEIEKKWYVLRAVSGKESKVKEYLEAEMRNSDLGEEKRMEQQQQMEQAQAEREQQLVQMQNEVMFSSVFFLTFFNCLRYFGKYRSSIYRIAHNIKSGCVCSYVLRSNRPKPSHSAFELIAVLFLLVLVPFVVVVPFFSVLFLQVYS